MKNEHEMIPTNRITTCSSETDDSVWEDNSESKCIAIKIPEIKPEDINPDDYFDDLERRIDFILVWKKENQRTEERALRRKKFFHDLELAGIQRETYCNEKDQVYYEKLHATNKFLFERADRFQIKMPLCETWQRKLDEHKKDVQEEQEKLAQERLKRRRLRLSTVSAGVRGSISGKLWSIFTWMRKYFEINNNELPWEKEIKYSAVYKESERAFFIEPDLDDESRAHAENTFFAMENESNRERIRLVFLELEKLQIQGHYFNKVFHQGYPLHDGTYTGVDDNSNQVQANSIRAKLHKNWAKFSNWYKMSPVDMIQSYFGEEVGLYFAFMTLYTTSLAIFSIVGIIGIVYGLATLDDSIQNGYINELCTLTNITMCPMCNDGCPFFSAADNCMAAKILHMFDNGWTVPYSCFVSIWAVIFLEMWKRLQYRLTYKWNCSDFTISDDYVRPAYIEKAESSNSGGLKYRPSKLQYEVHVPAAERRRGFGCSCVTVLFFLSLVILAVISCMFFNLWLSALLLPKNDLSLFRDTAMEDYWSYEYLIAIVVSSLLCLILIVLDFIFSKYAHKLTEFEYPRTQRDYDNSYSFKLFCFYFVNYYSWPFYIAFVKDSLTGTPPDYTKVMGYKWLGCGVAGCNYEVTIQMMIVMVFKPVLLNIYHYNLPKLMVWWKKSSNESKPEHSVPLKNKVKRKWERERDELLNENPLSYDYIEMVIQFGFVALFSTAFPPAAFCAFVNNIFEIRRDANKYTRYTFRSIPKRVKSIGIWQPIFTFIAVLSILTNVLQLAFISETIPKWIWIRDHNSIKGYAMSKYNEIEVALLGKHGLDVSKIPTKYDKDFDKCYYEEFGTYNENTEQFEYSKQFYRVWVFKLGFALIFTLGIYLIFVLIERLIPDRDTNLVELEDQTQHILEQKRVELRNLQLNTKAGERPIDLKSVTNLGLIIQSPRLDVQKPSRAFSINSDTAFVE